MALDDQFDALANIAAGETAVPSPTEPSSEPKSLADLLDETGFDDEDYRNLNTAENAADEEPEGFPEPVDNYNTEDQTDTVARAAAAEPAPAVTTPKPLFNPLHNYATYTYGITLYLLTKDDFNKLQEADAKQIPAWKPSYALISSGGTHQSDRAPAFKDDFYFDNLKMTTVVGMNSRTRGTNAIEFNFTIIEPYGLTLLDRIIDTSVTIAKSKNYQDQPYLLEVNFFGSKDLGDISAPIPGLTKRFPIKIIGIKIKTGKTGSEYTVQAVPYNHSGLSSTINTTPVNLEVVAGTVGEFFQNDLSSVVREQIENKKAAQERQETAKIYENSEFVDPSALEAVRSSDKDKAILKAAYQSNSYPGAVNSWYKYNVDTKKVEIPDSISFKFHSDEIKNSKIVESAKRDYNRVGMTTTKQLSATQSSAAGAAPAGLDKNKEFFNINAGTSIIDVINMVMRNSEYIRQQIIDPLSDSKVVFPENKEVKFYKIIPQITLNEFDRARNVYGKNVVYHILPYTYYNTKHPNLPYAKPGGAVKEYNYIYTGKNIDIIDFSIDFDTSFYTTVVVDRKNAESTSEAVGANDPKEDDIKRRPSGGGPNSIGQNKHSPISSDYSVAATGANTTETTLAASVVKNIYSESRGDMINVKLKILGDPHFIKQDDLYVNPGQTNYPDAQVMVNDGTIAMDYSEIFCTINFKTPVDMDPTTGLLRNDGNYTESKFSGLYKILTVANEFSRGQFIQTLDAVRIFDDNKEANTGDRNTKKQDSEAGLHEREPGWNEQNAPQVDDVEGVPPPDDYDPQANEAANQQAVEDAVEQENSVWPTEQGDEEDNQNAVDSAEGEQLAADLFTEEPVDIGEVEQAKVDLGEFT